MHATTQSLWRCLLREVILYCLYAVGMVKLSVIRSREVSAIQGSLMYSINGVSIRTSVIVRYRTGVRNSEGSANRGSTVNISYDVLYMYIHVHT